MGSRRSLHRFLPPLPVFRRSGCRSFSATIKNPLSRRKGIFDHSWSDQDIIQDYILGLRPRNSRCVPSKAEALLGNRSLTQLTAASNVVASSSSDGTSGNYATSNRSWTSSWKFWHDSWLFWFFWSWFIRRSWGLTNLV